MLTTVILAAALMVPGEAELKARIPDIFAKAEANYRVLLKGCEGFEKDRNPKRFQDGKLVPIGPKDWCSGFFPGSLWYLYEYTKDESWKTAAADYTERLVKPLWNYSGDHDIGFRVTCSAGNALRLTGESRYADFMHQAAKMLGTRFNEKLGVIRSWDGPKNPDDVFSPKYIVIIDNMMNLELLEWDAKNGGDPRSEKIARSQADVTDRHHFRPDGSAYHIVSYNPARPGAVFGIYAGQGATVEGAWARGQAWAIYGFTVMYRETRDPRYLARAEKAAAYWMEEPNMPADAVPYWDFSAVGEERDASAAAVTASALVELSTLCNNWKRAEKYRAIAVKTLCSLASDAYFAAMHENGGFLLKHSVGCNPLGSEVDVPLNYADYYFLEALVRFSHQTQKQQKKEQLK